MPSYKSISGEGVWGRVTITKKCIADIFKSGTGTGDDKLDKRIESSVKKSSLPNKRNLRA
jgi:hypothetical protein